MCVVIPTPPKKAHDVVLVMKCFVEWFHGVKMDLQGATLAASEGIRQVALRHSNVPEYVIILKPRPLHLVFQFGRDPLLPQPPPSETARGRCVLIPVSSSEQGVVWE